MVDLACSPLDPCMRVHAREKSSFLRYAAENHNVDLKIVSIRTADLRSRKKILWSARRIRVTLFISIPLSLLSAMC